MRGTLIPGCRFRPAAENLGNAPRLCDAAARRERAFRIAAFADRSHARFTEVILEALQEASRAFAVFGMNANPGIDERPDQPAPHRSLMVGRIARPQSAPV